MSSAQDEAGEEQKHTKLYLNNTDDEDKPVYLVMELKGQFTQN